MELTLTNGNNRAVISCHGAELKSLVIGGRELIWQTDEKYWNKSSPVLFPAIGNVKNNLTTINGEEIKLSKHGFMRDKDFIPTQHGESAADFSYTYSPVKGEYPFACLLTMSYHLSEDALTITYIVENLDNGTMWYCIGAHPAFACDDLDKCSVKFEYREVAATPVKDADGIFQDGKRVERINGNTLLLLYYDMFDEDVVYFDRLRSHTVTFMDNIKTLAVISFEGFETLGLWTPAGKRAPFLCIEPWCGSDDYDTDDGIFEHKRGIQSLEPKGTKRYSMTIKAE
ncbi:MAG: aldose 1-epimerase family protein [Eubacterium sp.]|nr:aldose 1-epimerase family protein [Eubacterium sp.]